MSVSVVLLTVVKALAVLLFTGAVVYDSMVVVVSVPRGGDVS